MGLETAPSPFIPPCHNVPPTIQYPFNRVAIEPARVRTDLNSKLKLELETLASSKIHYCTEIIAHFKLEKSPTE